MDNQRRKGLYIMDTAKERNNGRPAFPVSWEMDGQIVAEPGMTLRDYFAAKAMQGICAHPDTWGLNIAGIAKASYEMTDAMLDARK